MVMKIDLMLDRLKKKSLDEIETSFQGIQTNPGYSPAIFSSLGFR
jgi:hypothetical protein